jgi:hypothetical protein
MPVAPHARLAESNYLEVRSLAFKIELKDDDVEENSSTGINAAYSSDDRKQQQERQVDDFSVRTEMVNPPTCELKDGIVNEQCRDDTEDSFVAIHSMVGAAHEREWQVDDCSTMTETTNAPSVMTRNSNVTITEFVSNVSNIDVSGMQPQEIISDELNLTIETNNDKNKLDKEESEMQQMSTINAALTSDQVNNDGKKQADSTEVKKLSNANVIKEHTVRQPTNLPLKDDEETKKHGKPMQDEFPKVNSSEGNIELLLTKEVVNARLEKPNQRRIRKNMWGKKKRDAQNKVFKVLVTVPDEVDLRSEKVTNSEEDEPENFSKKSKDTETKVFKYESSKLEEKSLTSPSAFNLEVESNKVEVHSMAIPPACELDDGIDNEQCWDHTKDFFVPACSMAGAHERESRVNYCSVTTEATNAISAMTRDSKVAITEFVANVSKIVVSMMPAEESINDDSNETIEVKVEQVPLADDRKDEDMMHRKFDDDEGLWVTSEKLSVCDQITGAATATNARMRESSDEIGSLPKTSGEVVTSDNAPVDATPEPSTIFDTVDVEKDTTSHKADFDGGDKVRRALAVANPRRIRSISMKKLRGRFAKPAMMCEHGVGGAVNVVHESKPEEESKLMTNIRKGSSAFTMTGNRNTTKTRSDNKGIRFPTKLLLRKNFITDEPHAVEENSVTSYSARSLFDLLEVRYMTNPPARELENDIEEQCRDDIEVSVLTACYMDEAHEQPRPVDDRSVTTVMTDDKVDAKLYDDETNSVTTEEIRAWGLWPECDRQELPRDVAATAAIDADKDTTSYNMADVDGGDRERRTPTVVAKPRKIIKSKPMKRLLMRFAKSTATDDKKMMGELSIGKNSKEDKEENSSTDAPSCNMEIISNMTTIPPACKLKDGIDDKQCRDNTEYFYLTACSLAGAHEREWQVDDLYVTTETTNTISAMTHAINVRIAEFVENVKKMVIPSKQPEPAEQPPQEIINDDLNAKIEMNTDNEKQLTKSEMQKMSTGNIALRLDPVSRERKQASSTEASKLSDANVIHELTVPQSSEWALKDDEETKTLGRPLHDELPKADSCKGNIELIFIEEVVDAKLRDSSKIPSKTNMWDTKKKDVRHFKVSVIATEAGKSTTAPSVGMIAQGEDKEPVDQDATKPSRASVAPSQGESAGKIEAKKKVTHTKTEDEIFDETKVPSAPIRIKFHLNAMTRKRYFAKTRKSGVGSSELKSEEERTVPYAIPGEKKVDESIGESATSNKKNKWGKKKDKQYKVLKVSVSTDKKKFKTMPPVKIVTGGEEKEHADTNPSKTEEAASQLEIVPSDENVNKGNESESADRDVAKSSQIGVATSELASDAVRRVSLAKSLSSVHRQTQNDASFLSQPPAWMSSDIINAPMDKFNQLMSCTFPCTPHVEDMQQNDRASIFTNNLKDPNVNPSARDRPWPLTKSDTHFVIAAVSDNQATESVAMEAMLISQVDELKSMQTKKEYQDQPKLKVANADFKAKLRELDRLNARTVDEAVRATEKAETQCIALTEELQKMEEKNNSELQPVSEPKTQLEVEVTSAKMGQLCKVVQETADFKAKVQELEKVNAQKAGETLRAKEKVEMQRIAFYTKEIQKMKATLWSKSQPVSPIKSQHSQSILKKQISSTVPKGDRGDEQRPLGAEKALPCEQTEGGSKGISPTSNGRNKIGQFNKFERSESPGIWEIPSIDESDGRLDLLAKSLVAMLRSIHNNDASDTNSDASGSNNDANTNYGTASSNNDAASDKDYGICSSTEYSSSYNSSLECSIEVDEHESETTATREYHQPSNSAVVKFFSC